LSLDKFDFVKYLLYFSGQILPEETLLFSLGFAGISMAVQ
jgi:hypothetical protein